MVFELAYLSCASLKPSAFAGCGALHHVAIQLRAAFADQASTSQREHARKAALDFQPEVGPAIARRRSGSCAGA